MGCGSGIPDIKSGFHYLKTTKRIRRQFEEDFAENFENGSNFGKNCKLILLFIIIFGLKISTKLCNQKFSGLFINRNVMDNGVLTS